MVSGINPFNTNPYSYQPQNNAGGNSYGFGGNPFASGIEGIGGVKGPQVPAAGASSYTENEDMISRLGRINGELTPEMKRPGLGEHLDLCA